MDKGCTYNGSLRFHASTELRKILTSWPLRDNCKGLMQCLSICSFSFAVCTSFNWFKKNSKIPWTKSAASRLMDIWAGALMRYNLGWLFGALLDDKLLTATLNRFITFPNNSPGANLSFGNLFNSLQATVREDFAA